MSILTKTALGTALAATALASATPAMARDYYRHDGGGDTAGAAIAGGIIGLALGAIIASSANKHRNDRYRDGYEYRDGRRYDRDGHWRDRREGWNDRDGYYERRGYRDGDYYDRNR